MSFAHKTLFIYGQKPEKRQQILHQCDITSLPIIFVSIISELYDGSSSVTDVM